MAIVYNLIGVFFLTDADQDIGFPVFHAPPRNIYLTASVNQDSEILSFVPVDIEKYRYRSVEGVDRGFSVGDRFRLMFFRVDHFIAHVNLDDSNDTEAFLARVEGRHFIFLQIARCLAVQDKGRAVKAIAEVAKTFELDRESELSFVSSEVSLVSQVDGLWAATKTSLGEAVATDDIYLELKKYSREEAIGLLMKKSFQNSGYFPYLYNLYESRFGESDVLFSVGSEFIRSYNIDVDDANSAVERMIWSLLSYYTRVMLKADEPDRDFEETLDAIVYSGAFYSWCERNPELFRLYLVVIHRSMSVAQKVSEYFSYMNDYDSTVSGAVKRLIYSILRSEIKMMNLPDLQEFAWVVFDHDLTLYSKVDDSEDPEIFVEKKKERFRSLMGDRRKLLSSLQVRLARIIKDEAPMDPR